MTEPSILSRRSLGGLSLAALLGVGHGARNSTP